MSRRAADSLLIRVDGHSGGTLQEQIYAGIRRAIVDGVVPPGTRLPSSRALAADLRVSRTTSLLAVEKLVAEGYLTVRRGSGTFVASPLPDDQPLPCVVGGPPANARHPPFSRRGAALADVPPNAWRLAGPPRAFRVGTPALDQFPVRLWQQLAGRRLRAVGLSQLDYGECPALREAIADHVQSARGTRCAARQVVVVAGAQRGLDLVFRLLLDPGDQAWIEEPGYPGARGALLAAGARIVPVRVDGEGLDVESGVRQAPAARLAYVTPSHQFPLGVPMSLTRRLALLKWAAARAWVVEDDYDSGFRYGTRPIPSLHGLDAGARVIYVGSFSKTLFPSLRLGFLVAPPDLRDRLVAARRVVEPQPPLLDQVVLADFMTEGHFERHLRRMRAVYRERLEALTEAARRLCRGLLTLRPVESGLHAVADLGEVDDVRVCEEAAGHGVEVTPLSIYSSDGDAAAHGLLLGFGAVRPEALWHGMERLAAAVEAARRAPPLDRRRAGA